MNKELIHEMAMAAGAHEVQSTDARSAYKYVFTEYDFETFVYFLVKECVVVAAKSADVQASAREAINTRFGIK